MSHALILQLRSPCLPWRSWGWPLYQRRCLWLLHQLQMDLDCVLMLHRIATVKEDTSNQNKHQKYYAIFSATLHGSVQYFEMLFSIFCLYIIIPFKAWHSCLQKHWSFQCSWFPCLASYCSGLQWLITLYGWCNLISLYATQVTAQHNQLID